MTDLAPTPGSTDRGTKRLIRHAPFGRLLHWATAASVLILLATAFLPILGVRFAWLTLHWVTGIVLALVILVHIVRELLRRNLRSIWIGVRDLADGLAAAKWSLRVSDTPPPLGGKYSLAQKAIHHAFAVVVGVTIVTGALMMVKVDTPWWERDPYWLEETSWGVIYVLHDLAALMLVVMIMLHVYFALLPEKLHYTRSMILGWITREEHATNHDPERWQVDRE